MEARPNWRYFADVQSRFWGFSRGLTAQEFQHCDRMLDAWDTGSGGRGLTESPYLLSLRMIL
jgi:hypothetical protein